MKAPDKIYLNIHPDWTEGEDEPEITWSEEEDSFYDNIPYIRKDALLEWLRERESLSGVLKKDAYRSVIDKLNSL